MEKFCDIKSRDDLAEFLKIPISKITFILYKKGIPNCYREFDIPKKNGGTRHIAAPEEDLEEIQKKLADALTAYQDIVWKENGIVPTLAHAYQEGKGIITNAAIHRNKRYILCYDLKDFFPSIHFGRVAGFFEKNKFFNLPHEVAIVIAQLACFNASLPQGAPTSPVISNLICQVLDIRLLKLAKKYKLDYTRYADDLTFSTNDKHILDCRTKFEASLAKLIEGAGFTLNPDKTRLQYKDSRQEVTGLIVNRKLNVDRRYYKETRAMAHELYKTGHFMIDKEEGTIRQLEGRFSFIDQLVRYNNRLDGKKHDFRQLSTREAQYRIFLFYKYFYANSRPLIITEGKTDVLYLKAALIRYADKYPRLIKRKDDGTYEYGIEFLNKTKRIFYFFGLSTDGGDSLGYLYDFYKCNKSDKGTKDDKDDKEGKGTKDGKGAKDNKDDKGNKGMPHLWEYLHGLNSESVTSPVILLLDNEAQKENSGNGQKATEKPLRKFLSKIKFSDAEKTELQKKLWMPLVKDTNLFMLVNPLVDGKENCEIEDLFTQETLQHPINGKTFRRDVDCKGTDYCSKDVFSKYIYSNRNSIDFSRFLPFLDAMDQVILSYQESVKEKAAT